MEVLCGKNIPVFIPLISLVHVVIHYMKTPHHEFRYLMFDPTRRFEIWRFLTVALIHSGNGDFDADRLSIFHLWINVVVQLFFGLWVEKHLKFQRTAVLYFSLILFGTMVQSFVSPMLCQFGASAATLGLMTANITGHLMIHQPERGLYWKSVIITALYIIIDNGIGLLNPRDFLEILRVSHFTHLGGAVGGFFVSVILWPAPGFRRRNTLRTVSYIVYTVVFIVGVSINMYHSTIIKDFRLEVENGNWYFLYIFEELVSEREVDEKFNDLRKYYGERFSIKCDYVTNY